MSVQTRGARASISRRLAHMVRDDLMDLLLGGACVGCERPGAGWCVNCAESLRAQSAISVRTATTQLPAAWAAAPYAGPPRAALLAYKERGRAGLARPLGAALSGALVSLLRSERESSARESGQRLVVPALIVPVPSSASAVRRRGYDPLLRMARVATRSARESDEAVQLVRALRLRRAVVDQTELGAAQRGTNLSGAFEVPHRRAGAVAGRTVVVVDDVVTTGATAAEAVRALEHAEARVVGIAALAATDPSPRPAYPRRGRLAPTPRLAHPRRGRLAETGIVPQGGPDRAGTFSHRAACDGGLLSGDLED